MYSLVFYVPSSHAEQVKQAIFAAGAGKIGDYHCCCWQVEGTGQFCAASTARPFIGEINQLTTVAELRIEVVCADDTIKSVVSALLTAHPYQQPAYHCIKVQTLEDL